MKDLAKAMEACEKFDELKEEFMSTLCAEMKSKGLTELDTKEVGEVVDIIKDMAEAKKYCMEALYFHKVTEAMLSYEEPRYGYNMNRYPSGRFAPTGIGMNRGYSNDPIGMMSDAINMASDYAMGYSGQSREMSSMSSGGNNGGNSSSGYQDWHMMPEGYDPRYGRAYNEYCQNRKFYTAAHDENDKRDMDKHAEEHVQDFIVSMKDIWKDADTPLKKHMKESLTRLIGEMAV